ncbi:MAG TPA: hypothetical protein VE338_14120 [Ktedonobacterales bacterium]|nr:hypothetical protein [Ktedonobacterales bacterium]
MARPPPSTTVFRLSGPDSDAAVPAASALRVMSTSSVERNGRDGRLMRSARSVESVESVDGALESLGLVAGDSVGAGV